MLVITFLIAYLIFKEKDLPAMHNLLTNLGYFGTFLAGILYAYGFTAAPATSILMILAKQQNIIFTGVIAGVGALTGDMLIFKFIKHSFKDEIKKLSKENFIIHIKTMMPKPIKKYLLPTIAGILIASPLPDEIGVSMLATTKISTKIFSILSYTLNTAGIFLILIIGKLI